MFYVGLDSPEIAKERIKQRVANGGHGIPNEDVDRRFAIYKNGQLCVLSRNVPKWFRQIEFH